MKSAPVALDLLAHGRLRRAVVAAPQLPARGLRLRRSAAVLRPHRAARRRGRDRRRRAASSSSSRPRAATASATTTRSRARSTDVSRQRIANRASISVHPAAVYVGVKLPYFVDQSAGVNAALVALDAGRRLRPGHRHRRHRAARAVDQRAPRRRQRLLHVGHARRRSPTSARGTRRPAASRCRCRCR